MHYIVILKPRTQKNSSITRSILTPFASNTAITSKGLQQKVGFVEAHVSISILGEAFYGDLTP